MCFITATAVATALGLSTAAATAAAGTSDVSAAGIIAGIANTAIAVGTIGSAVMGTTSAISQSKNQQAMYDYQAKVAQNNAKIADQNAANERQSGLEEARLKRIQTLQAIGSQQTAMAGNGIDITQGTALDTIEDTAQFGELDALMLEYNAERNALNFEQQRDNFNNQANLDMLASRNAATAGKINATAYALNGMSDIAGGLGSIGKVSNKWFNGIKNHTKMSGGFSLNNQFRTGSAYQPA